MVLGRHGAHLIFVLKQLCQLSRLGQFCQLKDIIDFNDFTLIVFRVATVHKNDAPEPG